MNEKNCSICGIIFWQDTDVCSTCETMMSGRNPVLVQPLPNVSNDQVNARSAPENDWSLPAKFKTEEYRNYNPTLPQPIVPAEEPNVVSNIISFFINLPGFAKILLGVVIFSICFAFALKGFMSMDMNIQKSSPPESAKVENKNLEKQTPWFSSWFRSDPSATEILEKYETETFAKGKDLVSDTYWVSGTINFMPPGFDEKTKLVELKKAENSATPESIVPFNAAPGPWDMSVDFEMSMKKPNKMLMRMIIQPKVRRNAFERKIFVNVGSDGTTTWSISRDSGSPDFKKSQEEASSPSPLFNRNLDGITMTFLQQMYSSLELKGKEVILNREHYVVETTAIDGKKSTLYFDIETGLVSKHVEDKEESYILDYKMFNGALMPSKIVMREDKADWFIMEVNELKQDVPLDDAIFLRKSY